MALSFDNVFGGWKTERSIGIGTDGRVYMISRKKEDGTLERCAMKTIRIGDNRNESKGFNSIGETEADANDDYFDRAIENITSNIETIKANDGGKRFVRYDEWEVRKTSDGKGRIILIRLEEMRSLADLLVQFSFTLNETINLGITICKSLIRCRDFGYIYPNLKPENILFDKKGRCKLGDFGSFSYLEPSKSSVAYKRTQYYMAPEFVKTGKINCTCDTYALGLILYMLSNRGRLPFVEPYPQDMTVNGLNRSKEKRLAGDELPKPLLSGDALYAVIKKACAFDEKDRYLSPKQMLADLQNVLENKPLNEISYDDIFSVSSKQVAKDKSEKVFQGDEQSSELESSENIAEENKKKKSKGSAALLRDEISIPDVSASDYVGESKVAKKKKRTPSVAPIIQSSKLEKLNSPDAKKVIAIIIAIIVVIFLLALSLKLRSSDSGATTTQSAASAVLYMMEAISGGG